MFKVLKTKNPTGLWQICFLLFGSSWLLAPATNHLLSPRITLISQYEISAQPYSWLFRWGDIIAALLLILAVLYIKKKTQPAQPYMYAVLLLIGTLMLVDPIITTTCHTVAKQCVETSGLTFYIHAVESILVAFCILGLNIYDSVKRKVLTSTLYLIFQAAYGLLFLTKLADIYSFGTLSQYVYQLLSIIWLAWFVATLNPEPVTIKPDVKKYTRRIFAAWAYLNGAFAIILSLTHIHLLGFLNSVYFANDTAWLAQHGVTVGVAMLYISWRLWRGEHRARQLFLVLLFVEVIKYSVITPQFWLVCLYSLTFAILFSLRPYFNRGSTSLSWHARLQEAGLVVSGVIGALSIGLVLIVRTYNHLEIVKDAVEQFAGFGSYYHKIPHHLVKSSLLAHTLSVLIFATALFVVVSLFRPAKQTVSDTTHREREEVRRLLAKYSNSSEDYFKMWPQDKQYYWSSDNQTFIAYKITKSVIFALADPIGPSNLAQKLLLTDFINHWAQRGYRVCFLIIVESSTDLYRGCGLNVLQVGSSALVDTGTFAHSTIKNKWWRWQNNRAIRTGYMYKSSAPPHDTRLLDDIQHVSEAWLEASGHREQGFALGSHSTDYMQACTLHYLTDESSHVVAFANEIPIFSNRRQSTIDLMRFKPHANSAMPYLLSRIIIELSDEKRYDSFDLGFVPLANMRGKIATIAKLVGAQRFSAGGLEQFKNKFEPQWSKAYIAYDGDIAELAIIALNIEEAMSAS